MAIPLDKKTGINLSKGSKISLEKEGNALQNIRIGINWGMINKKSLFGLVSKTLSVDLDGSVVIFDAAGNVLDKVSYQKLNSEDGAILHSGDDRSGDSTVDDKDNETIKIDLTKVDKRANQVFFFINSFLGQDFADIPYSKIRIYEDNGAVLATFNLSAEKVYAGHTSMIMGKIYRTDFGKWDFKAIGEAVKSKKISDTITEIQRSFL